MKNKFLEENKGIFVQLLFDMTFSKYNKKAEKPQEKKLDTSDHIKTKHFHVGKRKIKI